MISDVAAYASSYGTVVTFTAPYSLSDLGLGGRARAEQS